MTFEQYYEAIYQAFDLTVEQGSDEELFCAGYLQGHFSVMLARCETEANTEIQYLQQLMEQNLQQAFTAGELEPEDQQQVIAFWQRIQPAC